MAQVPKPILVVDFDGTLYSLATGYQSATDVRNPPVPGAQEFCRQALEHFEVHVVSGRSCQLGAPLAIAQWLHRHGFPAGLIVSRDGVKPPGTFLSLDDRAWRFEGVFPPVELLRRFVPWNLGPRLAR